MTLPDPAPGATLPDPAPGVSVPAESVRDPWAGFRGVMAGTLVLEVLVLVLAVPVLATVGGGVKWWSGGYVGVLAVLMVVGAGLQRRRWALGYNLTLQVAMIAGWFVHAAIGALGVAFGLVWCYFLYIRRDITRRLRNADERG